MNPLTVLNPSPFIPDEEYRTIQKCCVWDGLISGYITYQGKLAYFDWTTENWTPNFWDDNEDDEELAEKLYDEWRDAQIWHREYQVFDLTFWDKLQIRFRNLYRHIFIIIPFRRDWKKVHRLGIKWKDRIWEYRKFHDKLASRPVIGKFCTRC